MIVIRVSNFSMQNLRRLAFIRTLGRYVLLDNIQVVASIPLVLPAKVTMVCRHCWPMLLARGCHFGGAPPNLKWVQSEALQSYSSQHYAMRRPQSQHISRSFDTAEM